MPDTVRAALILLVPWWTQATASAAVAVLANHTDAPVAFEVRIDGAVRAARLPSGEAAPIFSATPVSIAYPTTAGPRVESLLADTAYRFVAVPAAGGGTTIQLRRIGLGGLFQQPADAAWAAGGGLGDSTVRVLLCVDEEEPMTEPRWRARLAERLRKASDVVERHSGVRFEPAGYATWLSDNAETDFVRSLAGFEAAVPPPAAGLLAIGFSSQYRVEFGRHHLGGTRGALRDHILLKEWSPRVGEAERVELLVHELGHFLGAAHSPEPTSVMRPVLGDLPVRLRGEAIRFDAVNTLAVAMVGEEVRRRGARRLTDLTAPRRLALERIYTTLAAINPAEPAAADLLRNLRGRAAERPAPEVVTDADRAAAANRKTPLAERLAGDALTDRLARAGAAAANGPRALLVGLGVALDDVGGLRANPRTRAEAEGVEPADARHQRLNVLGGVTARGRADTLKHFVVSAAMVAMIGEQEANLWGIGKELADATRPGGSGFSFADVAANRAGVRFAKAVLAGAPPVAGLAASFRVENYVPALQGLEEGLSLDKLVKGYGGQGDPRFDAVVAEIDRRIEALPAYALMGLGR